MVVALPVVVLLVSFTRLLLRIGVGAMAVWMGTVGLVKLNLLAIPKDNLQITYRYSSHF
jgi:hypothetical protein